MVSTVVKWQTVPYLLRFCEVKLIYYNQCVIAFSWLLYWLFSALFMFHIIWTLEQTHMLFLDRSVVFPGEQSAYELVCLFCHGSNHILQGIRQSCGCWLEHSGLLSEARKINTTNNLTHVTYGSERLENFCRIWIQTVAQTSLKPIINISDHVHITINILPFLFLKMNQKSSIECIIHLTDRYQLKHIASFPERSHLGDRKRKHVLEFHI